MAKELPYFQFEPAEYLTKDVSFCSLEAQGFFINICCYYWQRECNLTEKQLLKRLNHVKQLNELVEEGIVKVENGVIKIDFLDDQYKKATNLSEVNRRNGSKGGRPKKKNPEKTELKANQNRIKSESKGIREDKIKEDKIKEENNSVFTPEQFLKWFNDSRTKLLEKPSNSNYLSSIDKTHLEILTKKYKGKDFGKAFHNLCNDKWANESNQIIPKHFLKPENFDKYLQIEKKPLITKKQKINRGWTI